MDEWINKIEALIDQFPDAHYSELLEEMISRAQIALDAHREDMKREDAGE